MSWLGLMILLSWSSPWKSDSEGSAPWISSDREEGRNGFFDGLNNLSGAKFVEPISRESEDTALAIENHELREIPWRAHRTQYPKMSRQGSWQWPVVDARVVSGFGLRGGRPHEGLDLKAGYGTRVNAAAAGRIVFVGTLRGYGKTVVVYHGSGWSTVYAHLSAHQVRRGNLVERGDQVALSGDSGRASGPHLHFEVRRDGKPVNPLALSFSQSPYLAAR